MPALKKHKDKENEIQSKLGELVMIVPLTFAEYSLTMNTHE